MSKGIRNSFKYFFIRAAMAIAVIGAAMLVDFSPASLRPNFPATKQALSGLPGAVNQPAGLAASPASRLVANYGKLPLSFEANEGQTDGRVRFLARGRGYSLFLTGDEAVLTLKKSSVVSGQSSVAARQKPGARVRGAEAKAGRRTTDHGPQTTDSVLRMHLVGANASAAVSGAAELPGKSNYFIGNDPKKWRTNVPTYAQVKYQGVYPGVDLVYYGNQGGQLEYDFVVAPGADPAVIGLALSGGLEAGSRQSAVGSGSQNPTLSQSKSQNLKSQIDPSGDLVIKADGGEMRFHKPVIYQEQFTVDSLQLTVQDETRNSKIENRQSKIDHRQLVDGRFVLTAANQVRFAVGPYDHTRPLVIDPVLTYSTFLGGGGTSSNWATGIAVDSQGNAYVTGTTSAGVFGPFPTTLGAYQTTLAGEYNAFVSKFNWNGSALTLVYSTYLGGSSYDYSGGIAIDSSGDAYVTGYTTSSNFPTKNPTQASYAGNDNAYVTELNPTGSGLVYSTFLGGSQTDVGNAIAVDSSGNTYVTGYTASSNFPTMNPFQSANNATEGAPTVFVTKLNWSGSALSLVYSTYLGGSSDIGDRGQGIAIDSLGNAYVTGYTWSEDFPNVNAVQTSCLSCGSDQSDPFVAELNFDPDGSHLNLVYSTFLGGSNGDVGAAIAVDSSGNAYVTGQTRSTDFPTMNPLPTNTALDGGPDAFVAKLNWSGSALSLVYSTYLGGSSNDYGYGIAVDSSGNAYVTGETLSTDFPLANPIQSTNKSSIVSESDTVFVSELSWSGSALSLVYSTYLGGSYGDYGQGIAVDTLGNTYVAGYTYSSDFPTVNAYQSTCPNDCDSGEGEGAAFVAEISPSAAPAVTFSSNPLPFGSVVVNSTSTLSLTITNSGTASLNINNFYFSSGSPPFTFASGGTCDTDGQSLNAGASCTVEFTFAPTETGLSTGTFVITDNAGGSPQSVSLTGTGTTPPVPVAGISPPSLTFSSQNVGTTSASQPVTLSNTGNAALTIASIAASANFGQTNTCGSSLGVEGSCTINVTFTPTATGALSGTLTVTDNSNGVTGSTQTVTLGGTGTGVATGSLSASSLGFGNQPISTTSAAQTETVTNTGTINLTIATATLVQLGGTNAIAFAKTADTCTGATVVPNGTCVVSMTFTPAATGAASATLTFTDNNNNVAGSTQVVALSGVGVDFAVASPTGTQTVTQGGQALYTINVASLAGTDSSAVTMACSNLPAQATCAFSPNPVTPGANGTTTQLTITTVASVYARMLPPSPLLPPAALPALLLATMLLTLMGWWQVRRKAPRWAAATCLLFGALLATTFMAGCGAGGYPLAKVGGTPAGSYTVTITGTSGSTSHTTTVTLTVTAS